MKNVILAVLILLSVSRCYSLSSTDRLGFSPSQPQIGQSINVIYQTSEAPLFFRTAAEVTLDVLFVHRTGSSEDLFKQFPMTKEGNTWKTSFTLNDPPATLLLFRIVSGDSVDDNNNNSWGTMVFDKNGRPVYGAHYAMSFLYQYGIASFKRERNTEMAKKELTEELSLYGNNRDAAFALWNMQMGKESNDSIKAAIRPILDTFYTRDKESDSLSAKYLLWYERLGDSATAKLIRSAGIARIPTGRVAMESRMSDVRAAKDPSKQVELLQKILTDFPNLNTENHQSVLATLLRSAVQAKNLDIAVDALSKMPEPAYNNFTQVAGKLLAKEIRLDEAEQFAKRAVELTAVPDVQERKYYKTEKEWKESADYDKSSSLHVYAQLLLKNGKPDLAESAVAEAFNLSKAEDPDIDQLYLQILTKNKKYQSALDVGLETVRKGKSTDSLLADMKNTFALKEGGTSFDALSLEVRSKFTSAVAKAKEELVASMRKKVLENRISKPSVDFTLSDLHGMPVRLSSLKGNVVILDFWATWCNPCKISFPVLKKVYDKYKNNPNVTFLAVDCWERQSDYAAILANAKKFQEDNKYEWTVLIDGKNEVVDQYGVEGIPTKFVIGTDGVIAFQSIGFNGPDMEEELKQQIEILLEEGTKGSH